MNSFSILFFLISILPLIFANDFMFAFGTDYGDIQLMNSKDATAQVYLPVPLNFFNSRVNQIVVDSNGVIWMNKYCPSCSKPKLFPVQSGQSLLACFWADSDPSVNPTSQVYFRIAEDAESWKNATSLLNKAFGTNILFTLPNSKVLIIATWFNISYHGGNSASPTNSFQCAIVSNGTNSYVLFDHIQLEWSNNPSEISNPAIVGVDSGITDHSYNNFTLPYSHTLLVTNLTRHTNFVQNTSDGGPFGWSAIAQKPPPIPHGYPLPGNAAFQNCWANGDPHYFTFDNHKGLDDYFHEQATPRQPFGTYILSASADCKPSDYPPFKIDVIVDRWEKDYPQDKPPLSTPAGMIVNFYFSTNIQITLHDNGYQVGNLKGYGRYECPVYLCSTYTFTIDVYNHGYRVETNFGLTAIYYAVEGNGGYVQVNLPYISNLQNNVFGYCGNMNGNPTDDTLCYNPSMNNINRYQECWQDDYFTLPQQSSGYFKCPYSGIDAFQWNTLVESRTYSLDSIAAQKCNVLTDANGPFADCQDDPNLYPIFTSCQSDLDASNGLQSVLCGYASMLAQSCLSLPNVTMLDWRNESFCAPQCGDNAHYSSRTSRCTATCNNPLAAKFCQDPPTEGCICNDGFVMEAGRCIWSSSQCVGCLDDTGNYLPVGNSWLTSDCSKNCTCSKDGNALCSATRCDAHAKCVAFGSGSTCQCASGYFGDGFYCSSADKCKPSNDCINNSTCLTDQTSYTCLCPIGYTGQHCEIEINHCSPDPCVNGTCMNLLNGYSCNCSFGFAGEKCDQKMNWCASFPCTNLATCIDLEDDYRCVCLAGYTGPTCECSFPSMNCTNLPDGDYSDPCLVCSNNYYSCSGGYLWTRNCEAGLYFDDVSDKCLEKRNVSACNPKN